MILAESGAVVTMVAANAQDAKNKSYTKRIQDTGKMAYGRI